MNASINSAAQLLISVCRDAFAATAKEGISDPVFMLNLADKIATEMSVTRETVLLVWESLSK